MGTSPLHFNCAPHLRRWCLSSQSSAHDFCSWLLRHRRCSHLRAGWMTCCKLQDVIKEWFDKGEQRTRFAFCLSSVQHWKDIDYRGMLQWEDGQECFSKTSEFVARVQRRSCNYRSTCYFHVPVILSVEVNTNKPTLRGILHHPEFINNEAWSFWTPEMLTWPWRLEVLLSFMARHGATLAGGSSAPVPKGVLFFCKTTWWGCELFL